MRTLSIDIETYGTYSLKECGVYKYTEGLELMLFGYAVDDGAVHVVDLTNGERIPADIVDAIKDDEVVKWAWNAAFERICLSRHIGTRLNPESWRCTMVWAAYLGMPLDLKTTGTIFGFEKLEGSELIKYFCSPCAPTKANGQRTRNLPHHAPEKWERFKAYNKRDVEVETAIRLRVAKFPVPEQVWGEYVLDQHINDRGIELDMQLVRNAVKANDLSRAELTQQMRELTDLDNPNSVVQMRGWLAQNGLEIESLGKKEVARVLKKSTGQIEEVLTLRQQSAKSSVTKYQTMEKVVCVDGRARGMFQFYGANRTGRWAGRLVQMQNLPQNHLPDLAQARELVRSGDFDALDMLYDNVPDVLSQLIRTAFVPKPGFKFIVADFSSIEALVLAWLADESWKMDVFRGNGKIYEATAARMFGVPIESVTKTSPIRQRAKQAELACIAEGELVLTNAGLVHIEKITTAHKVWDGENFVSHDGVVYRGIKEVINYGGLTATGDHLVWVCGKPEPIQFGEAAASGAHLVHTGNGGQAIRLGRSLSSSPEQAEKLENHRRKVRLYDILNAGTHHRFTVSDCLVHNCGYGGSVGALVAMGALDMGLTENELLPLVQAWRLANPRIVQFWRAVDNATITAVRDRTATRTHGLSFKCRSGMLFITLPSGRELCYVKPRIATNQFGSDCVEYEGVGNTKKWERLQSYGAKFVENCLAGDTPVLTESGWVRIDEIKPKDKVWDGGKWVSHEGLICKGWKSTISVSGVRMTGDHKILTERGWVNASSCQGLNRYEVRKPDVRWFWWAKKPFDLGAGRYEPVYDLKNCGDLNRFAVLGDSGAFIVHNCVQAISRDLIAHAIQQLEELGHEVVIHVHDECVIEAPLDMTVVKVCDIMSMMPMWADSLPLKVAGFECEFYRKD